MALAAIHGTGTRILELRRKLRQRENTPGYEKNCEDIRAEIKRLHTAAQVTTVYVTHDQVEAMTLAQRMIVMNAGRMIAEGRPQLVLADPEVVRAYLGDSNA